MGLIAAVPIGPVNLICIRRTFAFGPLNGFVSGLGAALGDGVFAAITGFGLTWIAQLIEGYATIIELIGGALLVWFGYRTFMLAADAAVRRRDKPDSDGAPTWSRAIALDLRAHHHQSGHACWPSPPCSPAWAAWPAAPAASSMPSFVVAGVVGGSAGWWLALTTVIGLFHARIDEQHHADHQPGIGRPGGHVRPGGAGPSGDEIRLTFRASG